MNNFFFKDDDFALFKKALRSTRNEPVVINILSTDSSLVENKGSASAENATAQRKNQSSKFEPSPFGRFFGPRRQKPSNVDMKDFSSWKNKNYREAEKIIGTEESSETKFSMSEFMKNRFKDSRYHDIDQVRSDTQKPIDELSTTDPQYKKFSLDSYMHKLEQQTRVKDEFSQNDDILEPISSDMQEVVPDSSQDENFGFGSDINVEKVAFDDRLSGEKFRFESDELDKVKARLEKMEREANNIKDKPTEKVIDGSELAGLKDDRLDLNKLLDDEDKNLVDDIEKLNGTLSESQDDLNLSKDKPKVTHKKFFEINKNSNFEEDDVSRQTDEKTDENGVVLSTTDIEEALDKVKEESINKSQTDEDTKEDKEENNDKEDNAEDNSADKAEKEGDDAAKKDEKTKDENADENKTDENADDEIDDADDDLKDLEDLDLESLEDLDLSGLDDIETGVDKKSKTSKIKKSDLVTKADFNDMKEEIVGKLSELSKKDDVAADQTNYIDVDAEDYDETAPYYNPYQTDMVYGTTTQTNYPDNSGLQSQIQQLIDANQRSDFDMQEKLRLAELEKENMSREYESKIRAMEQDFKQSYEDIKNKLYLDKLDREVKLQEVEKKFKKKAAQIEEKEKETSNKRLVGEMFKQELKSNVDLCNLEMDKKLLEVANELNGDDETDEVEDVVVAPVAPVVEPEEVDEPEEEIEEVEEEVEEEKPKTTKRKTTSKTTKRRRAGVPTRKRAPRSPNRRKIDSDIIGGIDFD